MMTPLKMWCLLPLAVLLLLSITPTETEVVQSMSQCEGFLLNETLPNIPGVLEDGEIMNQTRYKIICQTYKDIRRFVTLYDTENKIPVFSAYKFRGGTKERPSTPWKIEPQLEGSNMKSEGYPNQATDNDYKNNPGFGRGHLFPCSYVIDETDKISTFTLTNAVPQVDSFNNGRWKKMEICVYCILEKYCINNNGQIEGYVVTGANPGKQTLKSKKKVNIPSVLWSAFCCYSHIEKKWIASAHWGFNTEDGPEYLEMKTLEELQQELSTENKRFQVFPGTQCPSNETVAKYYPEINEEQTNKPCPPQPTTTSPQHTTTSARPTTAAISTQQLLDLLNRDPRVNLFCRSNLRRNGKYTRHQLMKLRRLCYRLRRYLYSSYDNKRLPSKEYLLQILHEIDSYDYFHVLGHSQVSY